MAASKVVPAGWTPLIRSILKSKFDLEVLMMQKKETWTHEELKVRLATAALGEHQRKQIAFKAFFARSERVKRSAEIMAEFCCSVAGVARILKISNEKLRACTVTDEQIEALGREMWKEAEVEKKASTENRLKELFKKLAECLPHGGSFSVEHDRRTIFG